MKYRIRFKQYGIWYLLRSHYDGLPVEYESPEKSFLSAKRFIREVYDQGYEDIDEINIEEVM